MPKVAQVLRAPRLRSACAIFPYFLVGNIAGRLCGTQNAMRQRAVRSVDLALIRGISLFNRCGLMGGDLFDASKRSHWSAHV